MQPKFELGQVAMTRGVNDLLIEHGAMKGFNPITGLLLRHQSGDWGGVEAEDAEANDFALTTGTRVLSVYDLWGHPVWVITEGDRSSTTILFPEEY